jgi:RecA-family ATPase
MKASCIPEVVIFGLAPGQVGMQVAASGVGKTTLTLNLCVSAACGKPFLNLYDGKRPLKILAILLENQKERTPNDLHIIAKDLGLSTGETALSQQNLRLKYKLECEDGSPYINNPTVWNSLRDHIIENKFDLVIIDTMSRAFSLTNENDAREVIEKVTNPLNRLAEETGAAILFLTHAGKMSEDSGSGLIVHRARGTSALGDNVEASYTILPLSDPKNKEIKVVRLYFSKTRRFDTPAPCELVLHKGKRNFEFADAETVEAARMLTGAEKVAEFVKTTTVKDSEFVKAFQTAYPDVSARTFRDWRKEAKEQGLVVVDAQGFLKLPNPIPVDEEYGMAMSA